MPRRKVFVSYRHLDGEWRDRLISHLGVLEHVGLVELWADTSIGIGADWRGAWTRRCGGVRSRCF